MSSRNASRLESGLIARKGEAAPAQGPLEAGMGNLGSGNGKAVAAADPHAVSASGDRVPRGIQGTIAVTVRLDPGRYERMKVYGARRRLTNQDILVEALDRYFTSLPNDVLT